MGSFRRNDHPVRAIGALINPILGTRPDLAYTVAVLGCHTAKLGVKHKCALDRAFRYLRATSGHCLVFQRGIPGWSTLLGGGVVSWSSKQPNVALSATKAKYVAGANGAKEAVWLRRLLSELGQSPDSLTVLHMNYQSAITYARDRFRDVACLTAISLSTRADHTSGSMSNTSQPSIRSRISSPKASFTRSTKGSQKV
jgi:hypothetical protein